MSSEIFGKVVTELAVLPEDAQTQVLAFIQTLRQRQKPVDSPTAVTNRYPLRGEVYTYIAPYKPAVPAEEWQAIGGGMDDCD